MIHISHDASSGSDVLAAAFGDEPDRWPLPAPTTPHQQWLRAIAAAGQGRYGSAYADLAALTRTVPSGPLVSLAHSARASFLRQLGWHALARGWDGRAWALAGDDPEAVGDALTGLAADALGVGRLGAAATLLARAEPFVAHGPPRLAVRRAWVAAELAMAGGQGDVAVRHAEVAVELAATTLDGAARHRAKSEVVLAAALCSAGALERARDVADAALELTGRLDLMPLRWALACLLADIADTEDRAAQLRVLRDDCASRIEHWGGSWRRP
ncbi:MAG: hypothetical protein QOG47_3238 [Mycobacterium sp.]|nr:hypothetical protein [Mycobacterium sp.]